MFTVSQSIFPREILLSSETMDACAAHVVVALALIVVRMVVSFSEVDVVLPILVVYSFDSENGCLSFWHTDLCENVRCQTSSDCV